MPFVSGPSAARRFFDRLAPRYDAINAWIYKGEWLERVRAELRGPRILDVGVGTGHTTGHLVDAVGIDLSSEMLRRARYAGDLVRANFESAPFRNQVFDTVVFAGSLYYLSDARKGLETAARLLRPGGRIVVLSPATRLLSPFVRIFSKDEYASMVTHAGFQLSTYVRLNWAACLVTAERP